jgi:EAL domain-containing protein (putative c-di-GMP-specific phosphodiesterase class I)
MSDPWVARLRAAVRGGVVSATYQPIVDVDRGCVTGFEALARFDDPAERSPERWFAAARRYGCAAELESVALRAALSCRPALPPNCFLTVNVSPDLLASPQVRAVWREHAPLGGLVIELTEQTPIDSYANLDGDLAALRASGALIAVDDAGAGYAGLRHLLSLRPSFIKLDRDLIVDIDRDEAKLALVEMVGAFAGRIDAWLLAEGIERPGELDALVGLGVPLVQGFHLARPGAPWPELVPEVAMRLIASARQRDDTRGVRSVMEPVPATADADQAAKWFADGTEHVVLVDEHWRPIAVYSPDLAVFGADAATMKVNADTTITDALLRALTRDVAHRWDPLPCTDNAGRLLGLVRIEDLARRAVAAAT